MSRGTGIPGQDKSRSNGLEKREDKASAESCQLFNMTEAEFRVGTIQEMNLKTQAEAR